MSRVTSKLQVTIPKAVAQKYRIESGTEVVFEPAGEAIRLRRVSSQDAQQTGRRDTQFCLRLFDAATRRQLERNRRLAVDSAHGTDRGWKREDLYTRGVPR